MNSALGFKYPVSTFATVRPGEPSPEKGQSTAAPAALRAAALHAPAGYQQKRLDEYVISFPLSPMGVLRFTHPRLQAVCPQPAPPESSVLSLPQLVSAGVAESCTLFRFMADPDPDIEQFMVAHKRLRDITNALKVCASANPEQPCHPTTWNCLLYQMLFSSADAVSQRCVDRLHIPGHLSMAAKRFASSETCEPTESDKRVSDDKVGWTELVTDVTCAINSDEYLRFSQQKFLPVSLAKQAESLLELFTCTRGDPDGEDQGTSKPATPPKRIVRGFGSDALCTLLLDVVQNLDLLDKEVCGRAIFKTSWAMTSRWLRHKLSLWYLALDPSDDRNRFMKSLAISDPEVALALPDTPHNAVRIHMSSSDKEALFWLWHKQPRGGVCHVFMRPLPEHWLAATTENIPGLLFTEYLYFLQGNQEGSRTPPFSFKDCRSKEFSSVWYFHNHSQQQAVLDALEGSFQTWCQQEAFARWHQRFDGSKTPWQQSFLVEPWLIQPLGTVLEPVISFVQDQLAIAEGKCSEVVVSGDCSSTLIPWEALPLIGVGEQLVTGPRLMDICSVRIAPVPEQIAAPPRVISSQDALPRLFFPFATVKEEYSGVANEMRFEYDWMQEELLVPHRLSERQEAPPAIRQTLLQSLSLPGTFHMAGKGGVDEQTLWCDILPTKHQKRAGGDGLGLDWVPLDLIQHIGADLVLLNICSTGVFSCHPQHACEHLLRHGATAVIAALNSAVDAAELFKVLYHQLLSRPQVDLQEAFHKAQKVYKLDLQHELLAKNYASRGSRIYRCIGGPLQIVQRGLCTKQDLLSCSYRAVIDKLALQVPGRTDRVLSTRTLPTRTSALQFLCDADPSVTCSVWLPITGTSGDEDIHKLINKQLQLLPKPEGGGEQTVVYVQNFVPAKPVGLEEVHNFHPWLEKAQWYIEELDRSKHVSPHISKEAISRENMDFRLTTLPASLLDLGFLPVLSTAELMRNLLSLPCKLDISIWRLLLPRLQRLPGVRERRQALEELTQKLRALGEPPPFVPHLQVFMEWIAQPMTRAERALLQTLYFLSIPVDEKFCQMLLEHPVFRSLNGKSEPQTATCTDSPYWRRLLDARRAGVHRYLVDDQITDEQEAEMARAWQGGMDRTLVFIPVRLEDMLYCQIDELFSLDILTALKETWAKYINGVISDEFKFLMAAALGERIQDRLRFLPHLQRHYPRESWHEKVYLRIRGDI
ncbi:CHAT domain-containing protein [Sansalvadorimonas verongulae]|uniref:hypothetical protein n=1 Tax=Sansalvadorimonas verongulae TaxID=2172824 RepID=UPI0012BD177A|nr:hypothetical protein [Sansalvadorimonas verongulae]MTI15276.1 hypothetical protein [Sansalvadorimonas verongulae]